MGCQYFAPCDGGADSFTVAMPRLTFGRGCLHDVGSRAVQQGLRKVALFTDPYLVDGPLVAIARESLRAAGVESCVFSDIRIEPCDDTVRTAAGFLDDTDCTDMVSVGGGSVIDTAKAALLASRYPSDIRDYFAPPVGSGVAVPGPVGIHIACPTTSGTGSECTSITVLRIGDLDSKFVVASPWLLPDVALVDPACCDSLPANVMASTGFDLCCHALECYTARAYTRHTRIADPAQRSLIQGANPFSDLAAREALDIVGRYLVRGVNDADDHEARDQLMWGASLAGIAFGNSGTHLPHALSYGVTHLMRDITTDGYPVAAPFIPHGISVVVNAPSIFRFTAAGAPERHLTAAGLLGGRIDDAGNDDAGDILAAQLIELMRGTHMPNGLSAIGFSAADVRPLAASSIRQKRAIANAPRESTQADLETLYSGALTYW